MLDLAGLKQEIVRVHVNARRRETNRDFDSTGSGACVEIKKWMLVALQLPLTFSRSSSAEAGWGRREKDEPVPLTANLPNGCRFPDPHVPSFRAKPFQTRTALAYQRERSRFFPARWGSSDAPRPPSA